MFDYDISYSRRKSIAISISQDAKIHVKAPYGCASREIERIISEKESWIKKHIETILRNIDEQLDNQFTNDERQHFIQKACDEIVQKAETFAAKMQVTYNRINIREQKSRWGSCSSKGNLNFNWRLILAPERVLDYVVVHELAHLKEMNHSTRFYACIEAILPDYKPAKDWLSKNGHLLWIDKDRSHTSITDAPAQG